MTATTDKPHWTETVYQDNARLLFDVEAALFQNQDLTRRELDAVHRLGEKLGTSLKSPILDIACGPGRHSVQLGLDGYEVTGLDFSPGLLELASETAAKRSNGGTHPTFVAGDMRQLEFEDGSFNTVLVLGNSFGYFSDEDNLRALSEAYRVLAEGGFFCVEITHKERYLETLVPFAVEIVNGRFYSRLKCEWRKSWDPASQRVTTHEKHSLANTGEVLYEGPYDVRLFGYAEIAELLQGLGLRSVGKRPFAPGRESLTEGLGETFGALEEVLFVAGIK